MVAIDISGVTLNEREHFTNRYFSWYMPIRIYGEAFDPAGDAFCLPVRLTYNYL